MAKSFETAKPLETATSFEPRSFEPKSFEPALFDLEPVFLDFDTVETPVKSRERPVAKRAEVENILPFMPEPNSEQAERARSRPVRERERDLPRGERWKRRLPKIMR